MHTVYTYVCIYMYIYSSFSCSLLHWSPQRTNSYEDLASDFTPDVLRDANTDYLTTIACCVQHRAVIGHRGEQRVGVVGLDQGPRVRKMRVEMGVGVSLIPPTFSYCLYLELIRRSFDHRPTFSNLSTTTHADKL